MYSALTLSIALAGCEQQSATTRPAVAATRSTPPKTPQAASQPAIATAPAPATQPQEPPRPKRPPLTWTKFMQPFHEKKDADIVGRWTGGKRLVIRTENVRQMMIDFHELPRDARRVGPWNLQIDEQPIEITGRRGWTLELTRSDNGVWNVTGPRPPRLP